MFFSGSVYTEGPCARILLQDSMSCKEEITTSFHMGTACARWSRVSPGKKAAPNLGFWKDPCPIGQGLSVTLTWGSFEKSQRPGHSPKSTASEPRGRGPGVSICKVFW